MKTNEFYQRYYNTPLDKRDNLIITKDGGFTTLTKMYKEIHRIDDKVRPDLIKQEKLLALADLVFIIRKDEKENS